MILFWFRRDLRLEDNHGLYQALTQSSEVLPIFIFDPHILNQLEKNDPRVFYIHSLLENINFELKKIDKSLAVFHDTPLTVLKNIIKKQRITKVICNHDYEPYALERDNVIKLFLNEQNIEFETYKDQVIFERDEIVKDDKTPYVVFTPYSKKWKSAFSDNLIQPFASEKNLNNFIPHPYPFLTLKEIGFEPSEIQVPKVNFTSELIADYAQNRNYPAIKGTSNLSTPLRFGAVSIRKIIQASILNKDETFWNELIWREFFMQILWHFPKTSTSCFREKYEAVQWNNNIEDFKNWCDGNTGYPIVDAGMREMNSTGLMHNRVRMIVASFLCKHLLIDWRWGEAYFANKLLDYEQSSNIGNWQWAAGCGVDAAPYFRIFNPSEQVKKFDNELKYIKKWVPEFQELTYTKPIVDHKFARERCLNTYKLALD